MSKTKTNEIHFPGWQFWIFSFTVNFLVLAVRPLATLAQAETVRATTDVVNNVQIADLEPKILSEINRVRTTPQDYARWLETQRQYYDGIWLRLPGEKPVRTNRGRKALEEAIAVLKAQQPLPPLESSSQTAAAASSELEKFANSNNIQYFSYGRKTATGIVMDLVVDELFPDRRRRQSLLSPEAEDTGVACKPDPRYAKVCAIAYSDSPIDNTNIADTNVAIAEPASPTAEPASPPEENLPENSASSDRLSEPEAEPTADAPVAVQNEPQEDTAMATLPVPPLPQSPPTSADSDNLESNDVTAELEEELQIAQAESEIEQKQQELAEEEESEAIEAETESSDPEVDKSEAEATESEEFEEAAEFEEEEKQEVELDGEASSEIDTEESEIAAEAVEVAINTDAEFSEIVEQGVLEEGDRVIADDGSLYDFYPLQGKEGDFFTIYLESSDFDAFVALVDSSGKTVGENDDISQEDSNSQIEVTLPADGVYNVIVNTYDEKGTGEYTLKVTP